MSDNARLAHAFSKIYRLWPLVQSAHGRVYRKADHCTRFWGIVDHIVNKLCLVRYPVPGTVRPSHQRNYFEGMAATL